MSNEPEDVRPLQAWLLGDVDEETISSGLADYGNVFSGERVPDRLPTGANPWLPRGPGNVGGRVRAFVPDIELNGGRPRALYAGAASGGVFRSLDDGLSWHSIWGHDMPSLGIGTIAVGGDAANRYLWVGTGEVNKLRGNGVYRMTLAVGSDALGEWVHIGKLDDMKGTGGPPRSLEASAVDPADGTICWFVGPSGIYRHRGGAWSAWQLPTGAATARQGGGGSDVKFMATTQGRYVVIAADRTTWGDLLLIDTPEATQAQIAAGIAAATIAAAPVRVQLARTLYPALPAAPAAPNPRNTTRNAKVAIVPDAAGDRIYAIFGYTDVINAESRPILGLVTSTIAVTGGRPAWATPTLWASLQPQDSLGQGQSNYNLVLLARAGAPAGAATDVVVLGMVDLLISVDGGTTFAGLNESWNNLFDRRIDYHPDFHAAFFDPGRPARLWVGTDGGVAFSDAWLTAGAVTDVELANWRRRVAGLMASQVYDLAQHPLSDAMGAALQDVGAWRSSGSTTWRHVLWGDGLGISSDPLDPYRTVGSSQSHAYHLNFDGAPDFQTETVAGRRTLNRGVDRFRVLSAGLVPEDKGAFEDTVAHPHTPGRILHLREKRVYHTRDGESWAVAPVGDRFELFFRLVVPQPVAPPVAPVPVPQMLGGIMVRVSGNAAVKLGFLPGETSTLREHAGEPGDETYYLRLLSGRHAPAVAANDRLDLDIEVVTGAFTAPNRFVTRVTVNFPVAEQGHGALLARIGATVTGALGAVWRPFGAPAAAAQALTNHETLTMWTLPAFAGEDDLVEVVSDARGAAVGLAVSGSGAATFSGAGAFRGSVGRPAVFTVRRNADLNVGDLIEIQAQTTPAAPPGAPAQAVGGKGSLEITDYLDQSFFRSGRQLAGRLQRACDVAAGAYAVWWSDGKKWVRLRTGRLNRATPIAATVTGNAVAALFRTAPAGPAVMFDLQPPASAGTYDLSAVAPPPVRLTITDSTGGFTCDVDFVAADFVGGMARATPEEVAAKIGAVLAAVPAAPPNDWIVEVQRELTGGEPSEAAYSPAEADVIWVGGPNRVYVSTDAGTSFRDTFPSPIPATDGSNDVENVNVIEAIAPEAFPPPLDGNGVPIYRALVATRNNGTIFRVSSEATNQYAVLGSIGLSSDYEKGKARVFAMVADPKRRDTYYAGTDVGVFRSTNGGSGWDAFSVGLPHAPVVDLAMDAGLDTLRAAVFGRGVFEKYLGDGSPLLADVFFHANPRDGGRRPVNHGVDLDSSTPVFVDAAQSPDLCLTSLAAGERAQFDAIELEKIRHETVRPAVDYGLIMRPHNRTGVPITDARVIALWAPVEHEVPPLPEAFWTAAAGTAAVASGAAFGTWTAILSASVPELPPGGARLVQVPFTWTAAQLARRDRLALFVYVQRGVEVPGPGEVDATSLVLRDGRAAMRLTQVQQDDGFVTLRVVAPATGTVVGLQLHAIASSLLPAGPLPATALQFAAIPAPGPQTVRTTAASPFDVRNLQLRFTFHETLVSQQTPYPPLPRAIAPAMTLRSPPLTTRSFTIDFREAELATPGIASAAQVRQFLASRLRQHHRLLVVEEARIALSLQRAAVDGRARRTGASWQGGAVVVTAAGAAAADADFAPAALAGPEVVTVGAAQRFTVRVWNHGDLDVAAPDTTVTLFWYDPHTDAPQEHALGAAQQVAIVAGQFADVFVEDTIAAISHDDVLILAQVDHAADPVAPRAFADWGALRRWATEGDNTLARLLRRA